MTFTRVPELERLDAALHMARLGGASYAREMLHGDVSALMAESLRALEEGDLTALADYPKRVRLARAALSALHSLELPVGPATHALPGLGLAQHRQRTVQGGASRGDAAGRPIVGFLHVALLDGWEAAAVELRDSIQQSGLARRCERLFVNLVGDRDIGHVFSDDNWEMLARDKVVEHCEFPALRHLWSWCHDHDCLVFYAHTKGLVTERQCRTVRDWRRLMTYFVVGEHERCIRALDGFDVCGVNWHTRPWPHFSGNFWWATSEYVRTLPDPSEFAWSVDNRLWCERWIGSNRAVQVACLHESDVDHYRQPYPAERYDHSFDQLLQVELTEAWRLPSGWHGLENRIQEQLADVWPISTIVEIGVDYGYSLFSLAAMAPFAKVIGVDAYDAQPAAEHERMSRLGGQAVLGTPEAEAWVQRYLPQFPNARLLKATSADAAEILSNPIDVLHLDAVTTHDDVAQQFALWEPKVRAGGCIMFHDTVSYANEVGRFFAQLPGKKTHVADHNGLGFWYKPKPPPIHLAVDHRSAVRSEGNCLLSLLIPTLPSRRQCLARLLENLYGQVDSASLHDRVEILTYLDNGEVTVGAKRNALMAQARGMFVAFIDDDDVVDDEYVQLVCAVIETHPDIDCIGFVGELHWAGVGVEPTIYSLAYGEWKDVGEIVGYCVRMRPPQHINPMRREIAVLFPFPEVSYAEDLSRSSELVRSGVLQREYFIGHRNMYTYQFDPRRTETQREQFAAADGRQAG